MIRLARPSCFLLGLAVALLAFLLDQWSKWWLVERLQMQTRPPLTLAPFFNLVMVWNHGISFGLLSSQNQPLFLMLVTGGIVVLLLGWLGRITIVPLACALGCVIGGALGNLLDRLRFGAVVDFLDFHVGRLHWPAFNVADSCIFIGVVLLCGYSMLDDTRRKRSPEGRTKAG